VLRYENLYTLCIHTHIRCEIHAYEISLTYMDPTLNVSMEKKSMDNHFFISH
jgi:hypothetical protein